MKIAAMGRMIDSGGTGAGSLVDGKATAGFFAVYVAGDADGKAVEVVTEHLWDADGALVRATAEVDGETATGEVIDVLMHNLLLGYIEQKLGDVLGYVVMESLCNGSVICADCAMPAEREGEPVFADSEWDSAPVCEVCGAVLDVNVIEEG